MSLVLLLFITFLKQNVVINREKLHKLSEVLEIGFGFQDDFLMRTEERKVVLLILFLLNVFNFFTCF
jgi:hypothetical protein